jgi:hypothetical protein
MKIEFTEYQEGDEEYRDDEDYRFGGFLTITAESLADSAAIVEHYKLSKGEEPEQLLGRARLLTLPDLVHVHRPRKRPYYEVSGSLEVELFQPYKDWARRTFGFEGRFPDLKLSFPWRGLRYTYTGISMGVEVGETVCYTVATQSEPWSGRTAQAYAEKTATRYMACEFGHKEPVREFIQKGNNAYYPNPKYGTGFRNPVQPRVVNEGLCLAFIEWWKENEATPAQLDIIARNEELAEKTGKHSRVDWLKGYDGIRFVDPAGDCDYDGKGLMTSRYTFEEFAAL